MKIFSFGMALLVAGCALFPPTQEEFEGVPPLSFSLFYADLKKEVAAKGFNPALLDEAYGTSKPMPVGPVLKAEKAQPENVATFVSYTTAVVSPVRIAKGRAALAAHREALAKVSARTGVPPEVIVALWGVETSFGAVQGTHAVIPALVTLAWKSPRNAMFKNEIFSALKVLEKTGTPPAALKGSWAGAMGQCQFMPSSYLRYGTDGDGDGKVDIWANTDDVFASTAAFIQDKGWAKGQPWRMELPQKVQDSLHLNARGLSAPHTLAEWKAHGLKTAPKGFANGDMLRVYKPVKEEKAFLLGPNFDVILKWNNSSYFAYSVLTLADALAAPEPATQPAAGEQ